MDRLTALMVLKDAAHYARGMEEAKVLRRQLGLGHAVADVCHLALDTESDEHPAAIDGALDMLMIMVCA